MKLSDLLANGKIRTIPVRSQEDLKKLIEAEFKRHEERDKVLKQTMLALEMDSKEVSRKLSALIERSARKPSLTALSNFADIFGLQIRKRIKALAGDYDEEIGRLYKQRQYKTAQWNRILAWGYAIWYVLRGPLDWVTDYLISAVKGR
jgi:hypothetical protein